MIVNRGRDTQLTSHVRGGQRCAAQTPGSFDLNASLATNEYAHADGQTDDAARAEETWVLSELDVALVVEMSIHVVRNVDVLELAGTRREAAQPGSSLPRLRGLVDEFQDAVGG